MRKKCYKKGRYMGARRCLVGSPFFVVLKWSISDKIHMELKCCRGSKEEQIPPSAICMDLQLDMH